MATIFHLEIVAPNNNNKNKQTMDSTRVKVSRRTRADNKPIQSRWILLPYLSSVGWIDCIRRSILVQRKDWLSVIDKRNELTMKDCSFSWRIGRFATTGESFWLFRLFFCFSLWKKQRWCSGCVKETFKKTKPNEIQSGSFLFAFTDDSEVESSQSIQFDSFDRLFLQIFWRERFLSNFSKPPKKTRYT